MKEQKKPFKYNGTTYLVYSNGDIYGPTGRKLKHRKNEDGYAVVSMGRRSIGRSTKFVHRIVAELFLQNPHRLTDVDHLDCNRMNPDVNNLEWVSHQENVRRSYERGSHIGRAVGEKNPKARLTPEIVLKLRDEYNAGITIQEMVEKYGYPWTTIGNAVKHTTWKHLP